MLFNRIISKALMLLFLGVSFTGIAQVPQLINYQAVVRDGSGSIMPSTNVIVRFTLIENSNTLYEENMTVATTANGLLNTIVGSGTPTVGTFSAIDWSLTGISLKVEVDMGTGYVDLGTNELNSVPYALKAELADHATTADHAESSTYSDTATIALTSEDNHWEEVTGGAILFADDDPAAGSWTVGMTTNTALTGSNDILRLTAPSGSSTNMDFIQFQVGSTINPAVAAIKGDGTSRFLRTVNSQDFGESGTPEKGSMYRDNTPIAWAYINSNGTIESSFGILSVVSLGTGIYYVYLNNAVVGMPAVSVTGYKDDSQGISFGNVHAQPNSNEIRVYTGTLNASSLNIGNRPFHIVVFGRPN